jgi:hypothetical protein
MDETYSDDFIKSLKKFSSIRKRIRNKIDQLTQNPLMGEPLRYDLRGLYSVPVASHFIIIHVYCCICRKKGDDRRIQIVPIKDQAGLDVGLYEGSYALSP